MALTVSPAAQLLVFKGLFGETHKTYLAAASLVESSGVKFDVGLYTVSAASSKGVVTQNLTTGTSALIKGTASEMLKSQCKVLLTKLVEKVQGDLGLLGLLAAGPSDPVPPAKVDVDVGVAQAEMKLSEALAASKPKAPTPKFNPTQANKVVMPPVDLNTVVPLKDAVCLGQSVKSTTTVYWVVGLTEHLAIAARESGGGLAIRVEPRKGGAVPTSIKNAVGKVLPWKSSGAYASQHFYPTGDCSAERVLGAVLFSLGQEFQAIATGKQLKEYIHG